MKALPPELISLVHHIELNKAGWWDKAVQRLIIASIWLSSDNPTINDILDDLRKNFHVNLDISKVNSHIDELCSSGILVCLPDNRFKILETACKEFEKDIKEAEKIEEKTKNTFISLLKHYCPSLNAEDVWSKFNEQFLLPLVREIGANIYYLISRSDQSFDVKMLDHFLKNFQSDVHTNLRTAINSFFDPKNPITRSYILWRLNTYFFVAASGLKKEMLDSLINLINLKPSFIIFVDTNFLFSIVGLHVKPSNEAATSLLELIKQLSDRVTIKLYVLPHTADETRKVLIAALNDVKDLRLTSNLVEATLDAGLRVRGIAQTFIEEAKKSKYPLRAEDYFGPYISNLSQVLKSKGVELFNQNVSHYQTKQEVVDDINDQLEYQKKRYKDKPKTYEQLEHDLILWHLVKDKRPIIVESPLEAQYWIITIDYRFLGFDAFKKRNLPYDIPICIHPTTLIQMLQFWIPRTSQFEEAMLSSIRLPFLFQEFDPKAEKVTIRILEALGRYENIGDFPKETLTSILLNEALRQRLAAEPDIEKQIELVKEELIEEHKKTIQRLKETDDKAKKLELEVTEKVGIIQDLQMKIESEKRHIEDKEQQLLDKGLQLEELQQKFHSTEERLYKIEEIIFAQNKETEKQKYIRSFVKEWLAVPFLSIGLLGLFISFLINLANIQWGFWRITFGIWCLLFMPSFWLIHRHGEKISVIKEWRPFILFDRFKKLFYSALITVLLGVIASIIATDYGTILKNVFIDLFNKIINK